MGCFWSYFLFSRIAQTALGIGMLYLLVHGPGGIALLVVWLLLAGYVTEWRVRSRACSPPITGVTQPLTASEHVSRLTAYIPWKREVQGFSMAPPAARLIWGELVGLTLGIGVLLGAVIALVWLGRTLL